MNCSLCLCILNKYAPFSDCAHSGSCWALLHQFASFFLEWSAFISSCAVTVCDHVALSQLTLNYDNTDGIDYFDGSIYLSQSYFLARQMKLWSLQQWLVLLTRFGLHTVTDTLHTAVLLFSNYNNKNFESGREGGGRRRLGQLTSIYCEIYYDLQFCGAEAKQHIKLCTLVCWLLINGPSAVVKLGRPVAWQWLLNLESIITKGWAGVHCGRKRCQVTLTVSHQALNTKLDGAQFVGRRVTSDTVTAVLCR